MPHPVWDNPADFIDIDDFGTEVKLYEPDGVTLIRTITGIFDEPYLDAQTGEYDTDHIAPRITAVQADLAGLDRGYRVFVDARWFGVLTLPQRDGTGCAVLMLAPDDDSL